MNTKTSMNGVPRIILSASAAFFVACIVSASKLVDSSVFICISSCSRAAANLSNSTSLASSCKEPELRLLLGGFGCIKVTERAIVFNVLALFETAFTLASLIFSSIFFCRCSSFAIICSCCRRPTIASRADCLGSRLSPKYDLHKYSVVKSRLM